MFILAESGTMLIRNAGELRHERSIDGSMLCELLHPDRGEERTALECSIAHAIVPPGECTLPHRLKTSTEIYYILSGEGRINVDGETRKVRAGEAIYIPPAAKQSIENIGPKDLVFLCIVDPKWKKEDEQIIH